MRDTSTRPGSVDIVQRGKNDSDVLPNKTDVLIKQNVPFKNNLERLLPSEYYHQLREWYSGLSTMK